MSIETTKTLHCDRCGFQETVDPTGSYSWMASKPTRCSRQPYLAKEAFKWVCVSDGKDSERVHLCTKCGESLMDWWDRK
jgi:hypothetical protein